MKVICARCGGTTMNEESVSGGTDWGCESCGQVDKDGIEPFKPPTSSRSTGAVGSLSSELARACVEHLQPSCTCDKAYWGRKMTDPSCEWCNVGQYILPLAERLLE